MCNPFTAGNPDIFSAISVQIPENFSSFRDRLLLKAFIKNILKWWTNEVISG
jgi:hypothetical protein